MIRAILTNPGLRRVSLSPLLNQGMDLAHWLRNQRQCIFLLCQICKSTAHYNRTSTGYTPTPATSGARPPTQVPNPPTQVASSSSRSAQSSTQISGHQADQSSSQSARSLLWVWSLLHSISTNHIFRSPRLTSTPDSVGSSSKDGNTGRSFPDLATSQVSTTSTSRLPQHSQAGKATRIVTLRLAL